MDSISREQAIEAYRRKKELLVMNAARGDASLIRQYGMNSNIYNLNSMKSMNSNSSNIGFRTSSLGSGSSHSSHPSSHSFHSSHPSRSSSSSCQDKLKRFLWIVLKLVFVCFVMFCLAMRSPEVWFISSYNSGENLMKTYPLFLVLLTCLALLVVRNVACLRQPFCTLTAGNY